MTTGNPPRELRRGWTTGACAAAATKAASGALAGLDFANPVTIRLPRGGTARFGLAEHGRDDAGARAGVIKDAGDDPDVTHGCLVRVRVRPGVPGSGVTFHAGPGVGTVTRPGLQLEPGEAAINPVPRQMMREVVAEIAAATGASLDVALTISIPGGEILAAEDLNPGSGSSAGCRSWAPPAWSSLTAARPGSTRSIAASTSPARPGSPMSPPPPARPRKQAVQALYGLPEMALLDMGDFAGGTLKYLRRHPVPRLSLAGGFAKLAKLAQGQLDLHSCALAGSTAGRAAPGSRRRMVRPQRWSVEILAANTAGQILAERGQPGFPWPTSWRPRQSVSREVAGAEVAVEVLVVDRQGDVGRPGGSLVKRVLILGGTGEAGSLAAPSRPAAGRRRSCRWRA